MSVVNDIKVKARAKGRTVVLPESTDPRVIKAAGKLISEKIAKVILLGDEKKSEALAKEHNVALDGAQLINPENSPELGSFAEELAELRKARGKEISSAEARKAMASPLFFGAMLVRRDRAAASVAGSLSTTGDVLRAAIQVIGLKPGISTVSSCFLMTIPKFRDIQNKVFVFGDCAVVPNPTVEQLASIAVSTAETCRNLVGEEPVVAMLSFSTKGSAKHDDVDKVLAALEMIKKQHPTLKVDGEFQLDAAIIPEVAKSKAPGSSIAGAANVLIFPDLDAGNIGYKLVQRLAGATATGPVIQGLAKPANDLSRGCSADDIVDVAAIATLMRG